MSFTIKATSDGGFSFFLRKEGDFLFVLEDKPTSLIYELGNGIRWTERRHMELRDDWKCTSSEI